MELTRFEMQIVHRVPEDLKPGCLYVCFECNVVVHLCACGCGSKVVLPIDPDFWSVKYNGESVSLFPSIGNFQFPCKSHYWIRENAVVWADRSIPQPVEQNTTHKKKRRSFWNFIRDLF